MKASRKTRKRPNQRQQDADDVVLRRWRNYSDVIALFPEVPATTDGLVMSYQHVGQHGAADYGHVLSKSTPMPVAEPDQERDELLDELRAIGYNPVVKQRRARGKHS